MNQTSTLQILKSETFGTVKCDFYGDGNQVYMTREQIGTALGYSNPKRAISDIHKRHKERLDKFSRVTQIAYPSGGKQDVYIYNRKGVMEICRWSQQEKADAFMDWVWEVIDNLMVKNMTCVLPQDYPSALRALADAEERRMQLQVENAQQKQMIGELKPKADYTDRILKSTSVVPITAIAKDYGMSGTEMNKLLNRLGVQYRMGNMWLLYSKHHGKGYTHSETFNFEHSDGRLDARMNTKWTQKGRLFLYHLLKENGVLPMIEQIDNEKTDV